MVPRHVLQSLKWDNEMVEEKAKTKSEERGRETVKRQGVGGMICERYYV